MDSGATGSTPTRWSCRPGAVLCSLGAGLGGSSSSRQSLFRPRFSCVVCLCRRPRGLPQKAARLPLQGSVSMFYFRAILPCRCGMARRRRRACSTSLASRRGGVGWAAVQVARSRPRLIVDTRVANRASHVTGSRDLRLRGGGPTAIARFGSRDQLGQRACRAGTGSGQERLDVMGANKDGNWAARALRR